MSRASAVEWPEGWGDPLVEPDFDGEFDRAARRILGFRRTPDCLLRLIPAEWVAVTMIPLFMRHDAVSAPPELTDLVVYLTSVANGDRYTAGLSEARLRLLGTDRDELSRPAALARGEETPLHSGDGGERVSWAALAAMSRAVANISAGGAGPARAAVTELRKGSLGSGAARELAGCALQTGFFNAVCTMLAVPPFLEMERMADNLLVRLARPAIARSLRGRTIPAERVTVPKRATGSFVFPHLISALKGSWYALWAYTSVDRCLESDGSEWGVTRAVRLRLIETVATQLEAPVTAEQAAAHRGDAEPA
ncbi:hypothetical protein, partial [Salinispira pacifica]